MESFEISGGEKPLQTNPEQKPATLTSAMDPARCVDQARKSLIIIPVAFYIICTIIASLRLQLIARTSRSEVPLTPSLLENVQYINTQGYITDLVLIKPGDVCPDGFNIEPIGYWAGTNEGCKSNLTQTILPKEFCGPEDTKIEAADRQYFSTWRNTQICTKELPRSALSYRMEATCGEGKKNCSDRYCIPKDSKCPISWVSKDSAKNPDPYKNNPDVDLSLTITEWEPGQRYEFVYSPSFSYLLTGFEISYARLSCWDYFVIDGTKEANEGRDRTAYPLEKAQPRKQGCGGYAFRSDLKPLDKIDELDFYNQNKFSGTMSKLPSFASYLPGQKVYLQARFAPLTWVGECWDIDFSKISSIKSQLHWFDKYGPIFYYSGGALIFGMLLMLGFNLFKWIQLGKEMFYHVMVYLINFYFTLLLVGYFLFESLIIFGYRWWLVHGSNYLRSIDGCFLDVNIRKMMNDLEKFIETEYLHGFINETAIMAGLTLGFGTAVLIIYIRLGKVKHYSIVSS